MKTMINPESYYLLGMKKKKKKLEKELNMLWNEYGEVDDWDGMKEVSVAIDSIIREVSSLTFFIKKIKELENL